MTEMASRGETPRTAGGGGSEAPDNLSVLIAPHLPFLRRYARALCGDQQTGDAYVASVLEALIADRSAIDLSLPPRVALYKLFQTVWQSVRTEDMPPPEAGAPAQQAVSRLTPRSRQILLLTTVEEFPIEEAAQILGVGPEEARLLKDDARSGLASQSRARVMVIEDEPIIALDLESIVGGMGHEVVGVADTRTSAVEMAGSVAPDLILADIQLADGSSGIDAVADILADHGVPVIFITAFPERLLTGERPEPTFLVTKPFRPETVETAIAQALFHEAG